MTEAIAASVTGTESVESLAGFARFLAVEVAARKYAIPLDRVIGVVESGAVTPLPFSPPPFEGLVLAMGQVVPQISVAILLGLPPKDGGVVVLFSDLGGSIGLRVDAVHAMLQVERDLVVPATPAMRAVQPLILGTFSDAAASFEILQLDHLTDADMLESAGESGAVLLAVETAESMADYDERMERQFGSYLLFNVGDDIYAIRIDHLIELLELSSLRAAPHAPPWIEGMIDVRGEPILGLSLAALLGRPQKETGQLGMMVTLADGHVRSAGQTIESGAKRVVLVAGKSLGIERYGGEDIHAMREPVGGVEGYLVRSDDSIVGIIDPATLTRPIADDLAAWVPKARAVDPASLPTEAAASVHQYLTMRAGRELLAVPVDRVHRLQASVELTPIPESDTGFDAMADVGDGVVPVIDLRRILAGGGEPSAEDLPPCLLAVIEGGMAGIIVDQILHIENIPEDQIAPAGDAPALPVSHILRLRDQLMPVLLLDRLLPPL